MSPTRSEDLLHVAEVAKLLDVSSKTLRRWDRDGTLPARRDARNGYRCYSRAAVARFAASRDQVVHHVPRTREALLSEITARLATDEVVWLSGPPGSGKTWLGRIVARGFGGLVEVRGDAPALHAVLEAAQGLVLVDESDAVECVRQALPKRRAGVKVLVETRRASAEGALFVGYLARDERIALLRERAPLAPLVTIASVAQNLEGHPPWLLRAARALASNPSCTPEAAIAAIDGAEAESSESRAREGGATLPDSVAHALGALGHEEREALETLAVIQGPFTVAVAAEIWRSSVARARVILDALAERSLIARASDDVFRCYEPIQRSVLRAASPEARGHARERADHLLLARARSERDRLSPHDVDALLDAADRGLASREALVAAIAPWTVRGSHVARLHELAAQGVEVPPTLRLELAVLEGALDRADAIATNATARDARDATELHLGAAYVARRKGEHDRARLLLARAIANGPDPLRARALNELAAGLYLDGRIREAVRFFDEAAALAAHLELSPLRAVVANNVANARADLGDLDEAERASNAAFALALDDRARAFLLAFQARLALERGAPDDAERALVDTRRTDVAAGDAGLRSFLMRLEGWIAHQRRDPESSDTAFEEAAAIALRAGEAHLAARARLEHALCTLPRDPARSLELVVELDNPLWGYVRAAAHLALTGEPSATLPLVGSRPAPGETADERCAHLLALLDPRTSVEPAIDSLRLAQRSSMTRVAVEVLRRHAPRRLELVWVGDQEAIVGATHVDLRRAPVLVRVLGCLAEVGDEGIDAEALLTRAWPDERLVRRRAIHRAHGRIRELRALGVPISFVDGRYRLAWPVLRAGPSSV